MRRLITFKLTCLQLAAAAGSVAIVVAWVFSLLVTDRLWWSQYVWWVPTVAWAGASLLALGAWWALARLHARRVRKAGTRQAGSEGSDVRSDVSARQSRRAAMGRWTRRGLAGLVIVLLAHAAVIEWRLYRWVVPVRAAEPVVRIANWNPAVPVDTLEGPIMHLDADIIAIVNQPGSSDVDDLAALMGEGWEVVRSDRLSVITRLPIKRWGMKRLGLEGRVMSSWRFRELDVRMTERYDEGRALFIEVEVGDDSLVMWVVDLPSDLTLARRDVMADAASAIAEYEGRPLGYVDGERLVERIEGGFPEADVIVGDFNAVRGSWSIRQLVGDRRNAFDAAGRGWAGTFPIQMPVAQIDQMFVGPRWKTVRYRIFDPGGGFHLAQVGGIVPAE